MLQKWNQVTETNPPFQKTSHSSNAVRIKKSNHYMNSIPILGSKSSKQPNSRNNQNSSQDPFSKNR